MSALPVTRTTVAEAFGRRVVHWGLAASAVMLVLFGVSFTLLDRQLQDQGLQHAAETVAAGGILTVLGLYTVSFLAAFLALTLAAAAVGAEIDSGVLQAVAVRPLRRWSWYLQRWVGLVVLVGGYVVLMAASVLLIARLVGGYRPESTAGLLTLMVFMAVFLVTFGMAVSVRLPAVAAGVAQFGYFGISWLGGFVGFIGAAIGKDSLQDLATAVSILAPTDGIWRTASSYAAPRGVSVTQVTPTGFGNELPFASFAHASPVFLGWSVLLCLGLLFGGGWAFTRRDL